MNGTFAVSKIALNGSAEVKSGTRAKSTLSFHDGCVLIIASTLSCDLTVPVIRTLLYTIVSKVKHLRDYYPTSSKRAKICEATKPFAPVTNTC